MPPRLSHTSFRESRCMWVQLVCHWGAIALITSMSTQIFDVTTVPCRASVSYYCVESLLPMGQCKVITCFYSCIYSLFLAPIHGKVFLILWVKMTQLVTIFAKYKMLNPQRWSTALQLSKPVIQCCIFDQFKSTKPKSIQPVPGVPASVENCNMGKQY